MATTDKAELIKDLRGSATKIEEKVLDDIAMAMYMLISDKEQLLIGEAILDATRGTKEYSALMGIVAQISMPQLTIDNVADHMAEALEKDKG